MVCPGVDRLEQYLSSELDDESATWIRAHLDSCDQCSSILADVRENQRIEPNVRALLGTAQVDQPESPPTDAVEGYRILRELGRGGTCVVYEAEQAHPRRRVALKLLSARFATDRRYERLLKRESQALARVRHPSIAAIYEAGHARDGRAYFAMEFIEGRPIVDFAKERNLNVEQRVRLFRRVCDAIAFAHQRGVIHRDLKPSNILVERDSAPKVLDFGLAKLLDIGADNTVSLLPSAVTEIGRVAGTVPYMSPEQVQGLSDQIDVRCDVYTLGVILYELLTGQLPYAIEPWNLPQAARTICEQPPTPPSRHLRCLAGDLETMVLKALDKDPARRYQSASDLAADLGRFLRDEPILARPAGTWYLLRKFSTRHRALAAGVAIAFVALVGGTALAAGQAYIATRERDIARRHLEYAQQASNYVFAGVGSQITGVLGTGDIQRHLAEAAYKFYKQLADEQPDDLVAQARLWSALRRLVIQSIEVGHLERANVLGVLVEGLVDQAASLYPDDALVRRELMHTHATRAQIARAAGDTIQAARHAQLAYDIGRDLSARYDLDFATANANTWSVPQQGPDEGTAPPPVTARRDWAILTAAQLADLVLDHDLDAAERYYLSAQHAIEQLLQVDPTLEPVYRTDLSKHAPLAPPVRLRNGARIHYERARARIHMGLAEIAARRNQFDQAIEHLDQAGTIADGFAADTAEQPATIELLASIQLSYARLFRLLGDPSRARQYANLAIDAHQRLAAADPKHVGWQQALAHDQLLIAPE